MFSLSIASRVIEIAVKASEPTPQRKVLDFLGQSLEEIGRDWQPVGTINQSKNDTYDIL